MNNQDSRLKGRVSLSRTEPLGQYRSLRLEFSEEFFLDEMRCEDLARELDSRITKVLQERQT
jgi:hypothetical protein